MKKFNPSCFGDTAITETQAIRKADSTLSRLLACFFILFIMSMPRAFAQTPVSISGNTLVCENASEIYTVSYTAGYTYIWNITGAPTNVPSSNSLIVTYGSSDANITVFVYDVNGILAHTGSLVVQIVPMPEPKIVPLNTNGCSYPIAKPADGSSLTAVVDSTDACYMVCDSSFYSYQPGVINPNSTYQWSVIPPSATLELTTAATGATVQWASPNLNQVTLRLLETNTLTGCSDSVDLCVRIIERPHATFTTFPAAVSGTVNICDGASVAFYDQSFSDPNSTIASWLWDFGDGSYSTQQQPTHSFSVSPSNTYTVKLIVENQCHCKDSAYIIIHVNGNPGPDIYCVSPLCHNTTDSYCTSYTCSTLQWSVTNGTITSASTNVSCIDVIWGDNGPGSISLQPVSCGGCPYPTSVLVPILTQTSLISGPNPACENATSFYSVPNVPATSYTWQITPSGTGTIVSGQNTHQISVYWGATPGGGTGTGNIKVNYGNDFLNCYGSADFSVTIAPKLTITGDVQLCKGATGNYTTNSTSVLWTVEDPAGSVTSPVGGGGFSYGFPTPGAYVVYAQDVSGNYCASPVAFQVQLVAPPPQVTANISTTICSGGTYTYAAVPTSNNYYLHWQATNGNVTPSSGNVTSVTWNGGGPWSLTLTQAGIMPPSCESDPTVFTITTPTLAVPSITGASSTCFNNQEAYSTSSAADTYSWVLQPATIGSIIQGGSTNSVNIQFNNDISVQTASLYLQISQCGTSTLSMKIITVNPLSTPAIVVPTVICQNQITTFSVIGTPPIASGTYNWDFGNGNTASGLTATTSNNTYSSALPYVVSVTVTSPNGCIGSVTANTLIAVNPTPVANITSPNLLQGFCPLGGTFSYPLYASVQTIAGTPSYTWTDPSSSIIASGMGATNVSASQTGVYSLSVQVNGCTAVTAVNLSTNCSQPGGCTSNSVSVTQTLSCTSVTLNATPTGTGSGAITNWQFPDGTSSGANPAVFNFTASGYYHVFVTATWGTCSATFEQLVTVPIDTAFKYQLACGTGTDLAVNLIDQSNWITTNPPVYAWSVMPGSLSSAAQNPSWNLAADVYTVSLTITENGGTVTCTETKTITVPLKPVADYTVPNSICEGNALIFTNTSAPAAGVNTYSWTFGDNTTLLTQNNPNPPGPNGVRTYSYNSSNPLLNFPNTFLTITDIYGCVSSTSLAPISVTVNQNMFLFNTGSPISPVYPNSVSITPTNSTVCQGSTVNICSSSTNPTGGFSYLWTNLNTGSCVAAYQSGIYGVIMTDAYGCHSPLTSATLNVIYLPMPLITGDLSYCEGETPYLSINQGVDYKYSWQYITNDATLLQGMATGTNNTGVCSSPLFPPPVPTCSVMSPSLVANGTGTMLLSGTITENTSTLNCSLQGPAVTLTIHPLPPTPTVSPDQCETGSVINLTATSNNPAMPVSMFWNTGQQGSSINVIPSGNYWVSEADIYGCVSIADTTHIWALPDFNPVLYGCYTICNVGTTVIPAPPGYSVYAWIKDYTTTVATASGTLPLNLTLTNPSSFTVAGGNTGVYQLSLTTLNGCSDISPPLNISVVPCLTYDIHIGVDTLYCEKDVNGNYTGNYNFQWQVHYGGASTMSVSLTAANGTLNLDIPGTLVLSPGANTFSGTLSPANAGITQFCFGFILDDADGDEYDCTWDSCLTLLPCGDFPPCELGEADLKVHCSSDEGTYIYDLTFAYGITGTVIVNSNQGTVTQNTYVVGAGSNHIYGTFTDTPPPDGVMCLDVYIYDDDEQHWCYSQICASIALAKPCFPSLPPCDIKVKNLSAVCYTVNALGQPVYHVSYDIDNSTANTYSFYVISQQGIVGGLSPVTVPPGPGVSSHSNSLLFLVPNPPSPLCFSLVATDLSDPDKICRLKFCIEPPDCDDAYAPSGRMTAAGEAAVNLYPNPTQDYTIAEYTLSNEAAADKFCVTDLSGRIVQETQVSGSRGKVQINTSALIPGMYFIKLMNKEQTVLVKKLIIQR